MLRALEIAKKELDSVKLKRKKPQLSKKSQQLVNAFGLDAQCYQDQSYKGEDVDMAEEDYLSSKENLERHIISLEQTVKQLRQGVKL
jgi:hypothetical protein